MVFDPNGVVPPAQAAGLGPPDHQNPGPERAVHLLLGKGNTYLRHLDEILPADRGRGYNPGRSTAVSLREKREWPAPASSFHQPSTTSGRFGPTLKRSYGTWGTSRSSTNGGRSPTGRTRSWRSTATGRFRTSMCSYR